MRDRTTFPPHLLWLHSHLPTPRHQRSPLTPHHRTPRAVTVEWSVRYVGWPSSRRSSRGTRPTVVTAENQPSYPTHRMRTLSKMNQRVQMAVPLKAVLETNTQFHRQFIVATTFLAINKPGTIQFWNGKEWLLGFDLDAVWYAWRALEEKINLELERLNSS